MKSILIFLLGAVVGAFGYNLYLTRDTTPRHASTTAATTPTTVSTDTRTFSQKAADTGTDIKESVSAKMTEWHLTPAEIKSDLKAGGKVVREKAAVAGDKISDARIVSVIKAKLVLDRDLSALDINVDSTNGNVLLTGSVASADFVGKALLHALDTDGVVTATANLTTPAVY